MIFHWLQISASGERMYHDAYTIQRVETGEFVETDDLQNFYFVAGTVPFLLNLIHDVSYVFTVHMFYIYNFRIYNIGKS